MPARADTLSMLVISVPIATSWLLSLIATLSFKPAPPSIKPEMWFISASVKLSTFMPPTRLSMSVKLNTVAVSFTLPAPKLVIVQVLIAASLTCRVLVPVPPLMVPLNEPVLAMVKLSVVSPPVKVTKSINNKDPLLLVNVPSFKPSVAVLPESSTESMNHVLVTPFWPTK